MVKTSLRLPRVCYRKVTMDYQNWSRSGYEHRRRSSGIFYEVDHLKILKNFNKIVNSAHDFNPKMKKFLQSRMWIDFCSYGSVLDMYTCFEILSDGERFESSVIKAFLKSCGQNLANWVIHEGNSKSLSQILQYTKFNLWKKSTDRHTSFPYHPVTECMYYGKWRSVDLLLSYGYNLEYRDFLHGKLVEDVFSKIAASVEQRNYLKEVKFHPYRKRCFLICIVITAYLSEIDDPYQEREAALKSIWKHLPDSYLKKYEFLNILDPFPSKLNLLAGMYDRYISTVCDGDYARVQQPRTLAHYSRCRVRQMMCANFSLPDGVQELLITEELKDYLLYK